MKSVHQFGTLGYFDFHRNSLDAPGEVAELISMKLERAAAQLEALGNPTRLKIYRVLVRAGAEGLPVGRIQKKLAIPGSTLSHHCKRLIETGLVTQERQTGRASGRGRVCQSV